MIATHHCPECGSELPNAAPEGLCPQCLLRQGLSGYGETPPPFQPPTEAHRGPFAVPGLGELAARFPQLEILELLGQGGMGAVYKARQVKLDRFVALKILPPEAGRDPAFAGRFVREAQSLARLNHPHIVTVHDFGESAGLYYFLMEYVDGQNLRQFMAAGRLSAPVALRIVAQVCDALQYAHEQDIVHRDIKPENVLLDRHGRAKIADFGLAKLVGLTATYLSLTGSHQIMGTLYYMAPEQMERPSTVDRRADVYSLGVVLYEMLTGELPLGRFAPPSHKARTDPRLDEIVLRALAKEPEERYQSVAEFKRAAESIALPMAAAPSAGSGPLSVPFSTSVTDWRRGTQLRLRGLFKFDGAELALEFCVHDLGNDEVLDPTPREVRIPASDLVSVTVDVGLINLAWLRPAVVITTSRLSALEGVPGAHGRAKLHIARHDLPAAINLAATVHRRLYPGLAVPVPVMPVQTPKLLDRGMAELDVQAAAAGLMVVALLAFASSILVFILVPSPLRPGPLYRSLGDDYPMLFLLPLLLSVCILWGAWRMRLLKSYEFATMASILAMLPWYAAWPVGVFPACWAWWILRRPRVKAAFAGTFEPVVGPASNSAELEPARPGRLRRVFSFFRSAGGYMFDTTAQPRPELPPTTPPSPTPSSISGPGGEPDEQQRERG